MGLAVGALIGERGERPEAATARPPDTVAAGIHKIKHVIVIMQENRSFDSYFGTYPGADGIPPRRAASPDPDAAAASGRSTITHDINGGGPHARLNASRDIDGGAMDGFVALGRARARSAASTATTRTACAHGDGTDVMGYHDARDIPNYWAYARNFVLQDHMFEPNASWSLPAHLFLGLRVVGELRGQGRSVELPSTRRTVRPSRPDFRGNLKHTTPIYAWTDLTYLLHKAHV